MNCLFFLLLLVLLAAATLFVGRYIHILDRKIQKPASSVLLLFFCIVCILVFFFVVECIINGRTPNWHNFLRLYSLFSQTNSVYSTNSTETDSLFYIALSLFGAVMFSGLMISAFTNMFSQRIYRIREGLVNYKFDNHIVIIGANSSIPSIINTVNRVDSSFHGKNKRTRKRRRKILVITGKRPGELLYIKNLVKDKVWNNIYFINSNIMSPVTSDVNPVILKEHYFRRTGIERSREIYIIGDEEPSESEVNNGQILCHLASYLNIARLRNDKDNRAPIDCYVAYSNLEMMLKVARELENSSYKGILDILHLMPYDYNLMLASKVWGASIVPESNYLALKPDDDGICRICIVGFNAIGAAMLKMAILKCHFDNGATTAIEVFFTKTEYNAVKLFQINYNILSLKDISVKFTELRSTVEFVKHYRSFSVGMQQYTVVLCDNHLDGNIQIAYALQKEKNRPDILIHSKLPVLGGIANDNRGRTSDNIHFFGNVNQAIDINSLVYNTLFLYMVHHLCSDFFNKNGIAMEAAGLSLAEIENAFEKYKHRYFQLGFDPIKWRLLSLIESFAPQSIAADSCSYEAQTIINQQIAAMVLCGYTISDAASPSESKAERYRRQTIAEKEFDTDKIQMRLELFSRLRRRILTDKSLFPLEYDDGTILLYAPLADCVTAVTNTELRRLCDAAANPEECRDEEARGIIAELTDVLPVRCRPGYVAAAADFRNLTLLPTNRCNFSCSYCYSRAGRSSDMIDFDAVKTAVEWFVSNCGKAGEPLRVTIYGGGEPMLCWSEIVRPAVELIGRLRAESGRKIGITLITNGSIIPDDFIEYIKDYDIDLAVSFEVVQELQNRYRRNYDKVATNLHRLAEAGISPRINAVVTPESVERLAEIVECLHRDFPLIDYISLEPESENNLSTQFYDSFIPSFFNAFALAKKYGITATCSALRNCDVTVDRYCAGELALTATGRLTLCPCISSELQPGFEQWIYGRVDGGKMELDSERLQSLLKMNLDTMPHCRDCFAKYNCGGGCLNKFINNGHRPDENFCTFMKKFLKLIIKQRYDQSLTEQK